MPFQGTATPSLWYTQKLSIARHPQPSSNIEIVNQYIQQWLRPFISHYQDNWSDQLPAIDFTQAMVSYNSTGLLSSQLKFGYQPRISYNWTVYIKDFSKMTVKEKLNCKEIQAFAIYIKEIVEYIYNNILYFQEQ